MHVSYVYVFIIFTLLHAICVWFLIGWGTLPCSYLYHFVTQMSSTYMSSRDYFHDKRDSGRVYCFRRINVPLLTRDSNWDQMTG